jgi:hypothetical protein
MKRYAIASLLFALVASICSSEAQAIERRYPPRYQRGSYAEYRIVPRNGRPAVQKVYNGYTNQFPVPSLFFYGYPHSYDATGIGF